MSTAQISDSSGIAVFCAASFGGHPEYAEAARGKRNPPILPFSSPKSPSTDNDLIRSWSSHSHRRSLTGVRRWFAWAHGSRIGSGAGIRRESLGCSPLRHGSCGGRRLERVRRPRRAGTRSGESRFEFLVWRNSLKIVACAG